MNVSLYIEKLYKETNIGKNSRHSPVENSA